MAPAGTETPEAGKTVVHTDPEPVTRYVGLPGIVAARRIERPARLAKARPDWQHW
jgi:hypothetical protein